MADAYSVDLTTGILSYDDANPPFTMTSKLFNNDLNLLCNGYGHYYIDSGMAKVDDNGFSRSDRELSIRGNIRFLSGNYIVLGADDIIQLSYYMDIGQALPVGATPSASLNITLNNIDGRFNDGSWNMSSDRFDGAEIRIYIMAKTDTPAYDEFLLGLFNIESVENQEHTAVVKIKATDHMATRMMRPYVDNLTYPATYGDILQRACSIAWIQNNTPTFTYYDEVVSTAPTFPDGTTCRDVIGWILTLACANGFINRSAHFVARTMNSADADASVPYSMYYQLNKSNFPICSNYTVAIYPPDAPAGTAPRTYTNGIGGADGRAYLLEIRDNPFIFHSETAINDALAQRISEIGLWMVTRGSGRFSWHGDETVEICDTVEIEKSNGLKVNIGVLQQRIEFGPETGLVFESGCDLAGTTLVQSTLGQYGWGE